ncbi:MAG: hypothetical protein RR247_02025 [Clostridia bacterium]
MFEYKQFLKRLGIYLLIIIPIFAISSYFFGKLGVKMWLIIFLNVVFGGLVCLIGESIHLNKKRKLKDNPKSNDNPFIKK